MHFIRFQCGRFLFAVDINRHRHQDTTSNSLTGAGDMDTLQKHVIDLGKIWWDALSVVCVITYL